jgi:hypothetical protein
VAEYDFATASWNGLQTGNMEGAVYTVHYNPGFPGAYIGGDFLKINGKTHPYIGHWHPYNGGVWNYYFDYLNTDGPVKTLANVDGLMLVGGAFEQVQNKDDLSWTAAPHLVYFDHGKGWISLNHDLPVVEKAIYHEGNVFAAHPLEIQPNGNYQSLSILKAGLWYEIGVWPFADSTIHGFCSYQNYLLMYGGFWGGSGFGGAGGTGSGMVNFPDDDLNIGGVLLADSTVRAALEFQGQVHVAGDFKQLFHDGSQFNGMARFTLPYVSSQAPVRGLSIAVTAASNRLRCQYEQLEYPTRLRVFTLQGQLVAEQDLGLGTGETSLDAQAAWSTGLYVWQVQNQSGTLAGKWMIQH